MLPTIAAGFSTGCSQEKQFVDRTDNAKITIPAIPPIDKVTSIKVETATFALG